MSTENTRIANDVKEITPELFMRRAFGSFGNGKPSQWPPGAFYYDDLKEELVRNIGTWVSPSWKRIASSKKVVIAEILVTT